MVGLTAFIAPWGRKDTTEPRQMRSTLRLPPRSCTLPSISKVPLSTYSGGRAVREMMEPRVVFPQPDSPATPSTSPSSM